MGAVFSPITKAIRQSRNNFANAFDPVSLVEAGGIYMFLNVSSKTENSDYLALTYSHEDGTDSICLKEWKCRSNEQFFKVEQCSNYRKNYVVSCYGNEDKLQWVVGENLNLELLRYPTSGEERLRPQDKKWRFRIKEFRDSKMYRILSMDDDNNCLALEDTVEDGESVKFKRKDDNSITPDKTQLWYLDSR